MCVSLSTGLGLSLTNGALRAQDFAILSILRALVLKDNFRFESLKKAETTVDADDGILEILIYLE
jgi:hypothetical protein